MDSKVLFFNLLIISEVKNKGLRLSHKSVILVQKLYMLTFQNYASKPLVI